MAVRPVPSAADWSRSPTAPGACRPGCRGHARNSISGPRWILEVALPDAASFRRPSVSAGADALRQVLSAELVQLLRSLAPIRRSALGQRYLEPIGLHTHDALERPELVGKRRSDGTGSRFEDRFQGAVLEQQGSGGLGPDSLGAGDVV